MSAVHESQIVLNVKGMTCGHCKSAVESAIRDVTGVVTVHVDLSAAIAKVTGTAEPLILIKAVNDAGYETSLAESH